VNLSQNIERYVERKRANGVTFDKGNANLTAFARQVGNVPLHGITTYDVAKYLDGPLTSTVTWRGKHSLLRHFFEFWASRGYTSVPVMPPPRAPVRQTFTPYIYTRTEVRSLIKATRILQGRNSGHIEAHTMKALLIVLYGTGALVGQVLQLTRGDVDLSRNLLTFRSVRFGRVRNVPMGADLREVVKKHLAMQRRGTSRSAHLFAAKNGNPLMARTVIGIFWRLRTKAGIVRFDGAAYQPRMHDLRATFAVHRITSWIKNGADLNRMLPALATYMGHVSLTAADRYLLLTPERFRKGLNKLSPQKGRKRWRDDPALMKFLTEL
jgi:integrase/recombinase XerD